MLRFEANAAQQAQLWARWALVDGNSRKPLSVQLTHRTRPIQDRTSEAAVAALSDALGDFSRELADAHLEYIFGKPEDWVTASPATYVKDAKVPMLVITEDDPGFQLYKSDLEEVVPKGSPITFWTARDRVHQTITAMMSRKEPDEPRDRMIEFIRSLPAP